MKSNKFWIILILIILVGSATVTALIYNRKTNGTIANIYKNGECIYSIDLSRVEEPYTIKIKDELGENTVSVEKGKIAVIEADCPDKVCVHQGYITNGLAPIVCLPHKLVIKIEDNKANTQIDGVSQ